MTPENNNGNRMVYSTEQGRMCPACDHPIADCVCRQTDEVSPGTGIVRVARETKGRKGKGVTVITGIPLNQAELKKLGKQLKKKCGTGGTVKNNTIEIQGDQRDMLVEELKKHGWTVKRSGG